MLVIVLSHFCILLYKIFIYDRMMVNGKFKVLGDATRKNIFQETGTNKQIKKFNSGKKGHKIQTSGVILTYKASKGSKKLPKATDYLRLTNLAGLIITICGFLSVILDTIYYGGNRYPIIFGFGFPIIVKMLNIYNFCTFITKNRIFVIFIIGCIVIVAIVVYTKFFVYNVKALDPDL